LALYRFRAGTVDEGGPKIEMTHMPCPDARAPRLFVEAPLAGGAEVVLSRDQAHYLANVMRRQIGDAAVIFNGRDGEWAAVVASAGRRSAVLTVTEQLRRQSLPPDIAYCFAPLKRARIDFIAQKATELGATAIQPVTTRHTVASRVNTARLRANAVEAAEQCGVLWVPTVAEPVALEHYLAGRAAGRLLVFCDEAAPVANPLDALAGAPPGPVDILIGPEGGFSDDERALLRRCDDLLVISLGPRIMRADTAGLAALTLVQATLGDWRRET
jgi:16S rRNA (uracil1498-N3)-methyltransferase